MNKVAFLLMLSCLVTAFLFQLQAQSNKSYLHSSLEKAWASEKQLATPESVIYHKKDDVLFVSNINGNPTEKDGNGFISKLSTNGKILNLEWVKGLHAPKGMGIYKDKLYVTDIDQLVEIDIKTGRIIKRYNGKKARFLNDITIDKDGTIYVSGMKNNVIHRFKNGVFEPWLSVGNLYQPNGLLIEDTTLLVGCMNYVVSVDLKTKHVRTFITETGSIDGLVKNGTDQYIISDWLGNVHSINRTSPKIKLLGTEAEKMYAADIEYISSKKLLLVPTFFDNRIIAYKVNL